MTRVIFNGKVYLNRGNFCEAVIVDGGRIARTGRSDELLDEAPGAEKIDAEGALVVPAFCDSHLHLDWTGQRVLGIEAAGAKSIEEVIERGRELIQKRRPSAGTFIEGEGVNPDLFTIGEKRDPRREDLDRISTENPLVLNRHCGHVIYCNSLALKLAGISEAAPEVEGGTVDRDKDGRPSGVLRENASRLVRKFIPEPGREAIKENLRLMIKKAHSLGISACGSHDINWPDFETILSAYRDIFGESRKKGVPAIRVTLQCGVSATEENLDAFLNSGNFRSPLWIDSEWGTFLKMGPLKLFADGSLGGQTAWMREPYHDKPGSRGLAVMDQNTLDRYVQKAAFKNTQVLIHAIGDAGIDASIRAFEKITEPGKNPLRHGIIHCQITSADLLERMAARGILALVQPIFLSDDIHILESRVGPELAKSSYAWNSMRRLGIPVSYGTDSPISPLDPLLNLEWAVLRRDSSDPASACFCPDEKVDVYSAFDAYTAGSAFASFDDGLLGRIEAGYLADLVFLDRDIFAISPEDIHKANILRTMIAGETVFSS